LRRRLHHHLYHTHYITHLPTRGSYYLPYHTTCGTRTTIPASYPQLRRRLHHHLYHTHYLTHLPTSRAAATYTILYYLRAQEHNPSIIPSVAQAAFTTTYTTLTISPIFQSNLGSHYLPHTILPAGPGTQSQHHTISCAGRLRSLIPPSPSHPSSHPGQPLYYTILPAGRATIPAAYPQLRRPPSNHLHTSLPSPPSSDSLGQPLSTCYIPAGTGQQYQQHTLSCAGAFYHIPSPPLTYLFPSNLPSSDQSGSHHINHLLAGRGSYYTSIIHSVAQAPHTTYSPHTAAPLHLLPTWPEPGPGPGPGPGLIPGLDLSLEESSRPGPGPGGILPDPDIWTGHGGLRLTNLRTCF